MADLMTDVMVDVETTGTDASLHGIIQLAAIKFNYDTGKIGAHFDRCPTLMPKRGWSEPTREFWMKKNYPVYQTLIARAEPARAVYKDFFDWINRDAPADTGYRFWAKPVQFDWSFVASHMEQADLAMPCHYRYMRDLNSFLAALSGTAKHSSVEDEVPFPVAGGQHNGLYDCAWQIDQLFYAKARHIHAEHV